MEPAGSPQLGKVGCRFSRLPMFDPRLERGFSFLGRETVPELFAVRAARSGHAFLAIVVPGLSVRARFRRLRLRRGGLSRSRILHEAGGKRHDRSEKKRLVHDTIPSFISKQVRRCGACSPRQRVREPLFWITQHVLRRMRENNAEHAIVKPCEDVARRGAGSYMVNSQRCHVSMSLDCAASPDVGGRYR